MTERIPSFRPGFGLVVLSPSQAVLVGDGGGTLLSGADQVEVARRIDGERTDTEIASLVADEVGAVRALAILERFAASGVCGDRRTWDTLDAAARDWLGRGASPRQVAQLASKTVALEDLHGEPTAELFEAALRRVGIRLAPTDRVDEADLHVVVAADLHDPGLDDRNRQYRARNLPWMLVHPGAPLPFFVPLTDPARGACGACASFWLRTNRPLEAALVRRGLAIPMAAADEPALRVLAEQVALFAGRHLLGLESAAPAIAAIDARTLETSRHPLLKRPQCPVCGAPDHMRDRARRPVVLEALEKAHGEDGGSRSVHPATAFDRFKHLVSPLSGPVSHLGPMPGRHDPERPVFVSGYRICPSGDRVEASSFQKVCAGKGRGVDQAKSSALFEAIERFSGVYQGDEAIVRGSLEELGSRAIHPHDLHLFSDRQYRAWSEDDRNKSGAVRIAKRYRDDEAIDWTPAWSLTRGASRLVPFAYCFSNTPPSIDDRHSCTNGNGTAAGVRLEEAILQGTYELVERDAVAVWWYNALERPSAHSLLMEDPYVERLVRNYRGFGWDLWALDLTHDLSIPVYAALARSRDGKRFCVGFGCHLDSRLALHRSLTELNQLFDPRGDLRAPWDHAALVSERFLHPHGLPAREPVAAPRATDLRDDIETCKARLERAGLEMLVVDKTRPDIGVAVAQVIVPGLRHFWPRLGAGRLYGVPVEMGWRSAPATEDELNSVPLMV